MIHLYLVCHGAADERTSTPDGVQALTAKGRKRFHKAARALSRHGEKLDAILTSPLVRAVQTAEILASEVRHGEVAVLGELAPGQATDALLRTVSKRVGKNGSVALVGHAPQLSSVLASLAHLSPAQASKLALKSGTVVRIDASGLPGAKTVEAKWWLKARSGVRKKGLPLQKAVAKKGAAAKKSKASRPAGESKAARPAGEKKSASRPKRKAAAKAVPRAARRARAPAPPTHASPREETARPGLQKFMGSPRPASPPPRAAVQPTTEAVQPPAPELPATTREPGPDES